MRILIAEDDQVLADGLLRTLRGSGAAVDHVSSGSEADAALMTNNEFVLLEVFVAQVIAAALGTISMGAADWLYHGDRICRNLHSVWVAYSITAICLPLLTWTTNVFLGSGMLSQVFVGTLGGLIFFWVYRNLRKRPAVQGFEEAPPAPSAWTQTPAARKPHP